MLFQLFLYLSSAHIVTYGSTVQLKGLFTKNRITIELDPSNSVPLLFSSRPPFKDGWFWVIEPLNESVEAMKHPVKCGDVVTFFNSLNTFYISLQDKKLVAPTKFLSEGGNSAWQVICDDQKEVWRQDDAVQFYNEANKCFLYTGFEQLPKTEPGAQIYYLNCTQSSRETQWRAAEGVYLTSEGTDL